MTQYPMAPETAPPALSLVEEPKVLSHPIPQGFVARLREDVIMRLVRTLPEWPFSVVMHARYHHRFSTFRKPYRYTELVNVKKLKNRDPLLTRTADKYAVREYVARTIGEQYLIPMQQVVDRPEQIDWERLSGRVVIKGTHGCNMTMVVNADAVIDQSVVNEVASGWLRQNWYGVWKEWAYRDIPPRLIIEDFIGDEHHPPADYKFHVFNGRVELVQVDTDRFRGHKSTLFTPQWRQLLVGAAFGLPEEVPQRPENLDEMCQLAQRLAEPFEYVRIDLYNVHGRVYFGEITHYPGAVSVKFDPPTFDVALGELWRKGTPIPETFFVD